MVEKFLEIVGKHDGQVILANLADIAFLYASNEDPDKLHLYLKSRPTESIEVLCADRETVLYDFRAAVEIC